MNPIDLEPFDCTGSDWDGQCSKSYHHEYREDPTRPRDGCQVHFMYDGSRDAPCGGMKNHHWHKSVWSCDGCNDTGVTWAVPYEDWLLGLEGPPTACDCETGAEMKEFL